MGSNLDREVDLNPRIEFEENCPTFDESMISIQLDSQPNQSTNVGKSINWLLGNKIKRALVTNIDMFTRSLANMLRINLDFLSDKLAILPQVRSIA